MALEKDQRPPAPKGQFLQIFLFMIILFVLLDPRLRAFLGHTVGLVLNPLIGFGGRLPILTILLAALLMIGASTLVRHFLVDWIKIARIQNTMRAFQKAMRDARMSRDQRRIEQLTKFQGKLMGMQAELSGGQMKPMAATMLIVIPLFAWLWEFIQALPYPFFSAPWNTEVDMFSNNGILFGTSLLPHWILFYSAISIPFGALLQKGLKYWSWREHRHLVKPGNAMDTLA
jgi:uncharacterized membrane protein (DUF106 family)